MTLPQQDGRVDLPISSLLCLLIPKEAYSSPSEMVLLTPQGGLKRGQDRLDCAPSKSW